MSTASKIEWTQTTWNPVTGCDRISEGCDHCYALTLAKRLKAMGSAKYQVDGDPRTSGPGFGVTVHERAMLEPLSWRTPRTVFVNSMSDLGHARVGRRATARIWAVMALTGRHQFQVLTKRPKRLADLLVDPAFVREVGVQASDIIGHTAPHRGRWRLDLGGQRLAGDSGIGGGWTTETSHHADGTIANTLWLPPWPLPNVWLGTTIESAQYISRADDIRRAPAAIRFLSCEPLLRPLTGLDLTGIDWVIAGGESGGAAARPMHPDWARSLRDQCRAENVAFFFKQWGEWAPAGRGIGLAQHNVGREVLLGQSLDDMGHRQVMRRVGKHAAGRLLDDRTWDEYPTGHCPAAVIA
jgi:protein gp37